MLLPRARLLPWLLLAAMAVCAVPRWVKATPAIADAADFIEQTERLRTRDHPQFIERLAVLERESPALTPAQRWQLRYLKSWEAMFEGKYADAEVQMKDIIAHSGDDILATKASALLLSNLGINRRYPEAFTLANRLTPDLDRVTDPLARYMLLSNLSQMLNLADQTDLAIKYASLMEGTLPPGENLCYPLSLQAAALYNSKRLRSDSPELQRAIDTCVSAKQPVVTDTVWLITVSVLLDEGQATKAMALLDRIDPSVRLNHFYPHMLSAQAQRAQAYAQLGENAEAKKAALAAIAMGGPEDVGDWQRDAYEVLYRVEKAGGSAAAALTYYEHYVAQDKGYLTDITARSLAYEVSQQHLIVRQLETESLSKQNRILRLQQALDTNAVSTSRLYIILLLVVLASIVLWLVRLKRSQLRFMKLSALDGLTSILNHQHFMSEAEHTIRLLEKKQGTACFVSIDLDHFKQVNDTHGHAAGDAVLRRTVALCRQHLRPTDLLGRLGGEEFGILLPGCTGTQGMSMAERLRMALEASPVEDDGRIVSFSASVGVASTDTCGYDLQRLCREADAALYRAKRAGRNRVIADSENDNLTTA